MSIISLDRSAAHMWEMDVPPQLCVGTPKHMFLYGGAGLAIAISAMEAQTGRTTLWASAQYLSFVRPSDHMVISVEESARGKRSSQASAKLSGRDGLAIVATGSFGGSLEQRPDEAEAPTDHWEAMPETAPPDAWPAMAFSWTRPDDDLYAQFDIRVAKGRYGAARADTSLSRDGNVRIWARHRAGAQVDAALIAVIADFLPSAVASVAGHSAVANSLDNLVRIASLAASDWMLFDIDVHGIGGGFGHASGRLFAADGTLLALASQTVALRFPRAA